MQYPVIITLKVYVVGWWVAVEKFPKIALHDEVVQPLSAQGQGVTGVGIAFEKSRDFRTVYPVIRQDFGPQEGVERIIGKLGGQTAGLLRLALPQGFFGPE